MHAGLMQERSMQRMPKESEMKSSKTTITGSPLVETDSRRHPMSPPAEVAMSREEGT